MPKKAHYVRLARFYQAWVLDRPWIMLLLIAIWVGFWAWHARDFQLDASADSIVLENDTDLLYYRYVRARYGSSDYLIVTYTPNEDLFSPTVLNDLKHLRDSLAAMDNIAEVISILDVPLIDSPRPTAEELSAGARTLEDPDTRIELARKELLESPFYKDLIVGVDGRTTALQLLFQYDETFYRLLNRRDELREKQNHTKLTPAERAELRSVSSEFDHHSTRFQDQQGRDIIRIREIMAEHADTAVLHLGGVPMIASDMIDFIRHDLVVFGGGVFLFILGILAYVFRRGRWILLSLATCFSSATVMMGFLGFFDWRVTVVSSNFISLLLIITLSLSIHLIVRFRELRLFHGNADQRKLVWETIRSKARPSFYTAATTIVAFGSLLVSGIRPVIDFGWMMVFGIAAAFVLTFTLFPAGLVLFKPAEPIMRRDITGKITGCFVTLISRNTTAVVSVYVLIVVLSIVGITKLTVENRFIDYFKETTEIFQGMDLIDRQLGGTTPIDIIISAPEEFIEEQRELQAFRKEAGDDSDDAGLAGTSYWFNALQFDELYAIHDYLDELPETGKVLSLATSIRLFHQLTEKPLDNFELSILHKRLPPEINATLLEPYLSKDGNEIRIAARLLETRVATYRNELLTKMRSDLVTQHNIADERLHISGMGVLYNNVLQSLYRSQILTLGMVFFAIMLMFLFLFQSWRLAILGIIPNMVAAGLVLGTMGWLHIPLDIMTITIAAITIGIGVDDTIHYIHRFLVEFENSDGDYWADVKRCHASIGRAMYYTTVTVTLGFSILALSNFIPTIYFGVLTGLGMTAALVANLTLLPLLLVKFKALG